MSDRQLISSGWIMEERFGYSRAVRVGNQVFVAGTTATADDGSIVGVGDAYEQTRFTLQRIGRALAQAGSSFSDVVRYRCFVTNIDYANDCGRAFREVFAEIRPVSTMLAISGLVHPDMLVEIEVDAIIGSGRA